MLEDIAFIPLNPFYSYMHGILNMCVCIEHAYSNKELGKSAYMSPSSTLTGFNVSLEIAPNDCKNSVASISLLLCNGFSY